MNDWYLIFWLALAGAVFGFLWWKGHIMRLNRFVAETKAELKKCSWPTVQELKGSTVLVIMATALLGVLVVILDLVFFGFVTWIFDAVA